MNSKAIRPNNIGTFLLFSLLIFIFTSTLYTSNANAQEETNWQTWLQQLRQEAIAQGINPTVFDNAFSNMHGPNQQVLFFDHTQPETRITFMKYRDTRVDPLRIRMGQIEYQNNQKLLTQIGNDYGVDPCFITAIWGMETSYGHYMGDFSVINSLATLAYDSSRQEYFRSELLIALQILNEGDVSNKNFKGEWAGASGYPQFMPSSWQKYAVDYDHDGRRDIWQSVSDGLASIGNYLAMNGWQATQPWAIEVSFPADFDKNLIGLNTVKSVAQWQALGIQPLDGFTMPAQDLNASIVQPLGGPAFMTFNNFNTILQYNSSIFYACSVGYLADKICGRE